MLLQAAAADTDLVAAAADTDLVLAYCIVHLQTVLQDDVTLIRRRFCCHGKQKAYILLRKFYSSWQTLKERFL